MMPRDVVIAALALHGLVYISGFAAGLFGLPVDFNDKPWLFAKNVTLKSPAGRAFGLLWLLAALALVGAGVGLFNGAGWWPGLAIAGAVLSLVAILPWWNTVVPGAKVGAVFDILILLALLLPWSGQVITRLAP